MRLLLTGRRSLEIQQTADHTDIPEGEVLLKVLCCGICRTDAKMWDQGHRDLALPRVPGHEMIVADDKGRRYAVWPGSVCGRCGYCKTGRENLCRDIRIMGFHRDGGFADKVMVPKTSLLSVPETLDTPVACLAEPAGCVMHALEKCGLERRKRKRVLVYGGGTMGILTALAARDSGAESVIIEKNPDKIKAARAILEEAEIPCLQAVRQTVYDLIINACPDTEAFRQGLKMLDNAGCFCFFSGLTAGTAVDADIINLIHYREITMVGSYGLNRKDMQRALRYLSKKRTILKALVGNTIKPEEVSAIMGQVLSGRGFRKMIDFNKR